MWKYPRDAFVDFSLLSKLTAQEPHPVSWLWKSWALGLCWSRPVVACKSWHCASFPHSKFSDGDVGSLNLAMVGVFPWWKSANPVIEGPFLPQLKYWLLNIYSTALNCMSFSSFSLQLGSHSIVYFTSWMSKRLLRFHMQCLVFALQKDFSCCPLHFIKWSLHSQAKILGGHPWLFSFLHI